ncbi:hypothetical protein [Saccharicrinis sp. FJH54]|uniref:hypothetical protein n=1 Tax=Saccharicrinis sp. FJH54 TaxID=3344665 RepID=UPI0035D475A6
MKKISFILLSLILLVTTSCEKDKNDDIRDQAIGNYQATWKFYVLDNNTLSYLGSDFDLTENYLVKKSTTDDSGIDFYVGGDIEFQGNKIELASNGFAFDIPSQNYTDSTGTYVMNGYDGLDLDGKKYNGVYYSAEDKIETYITMTMDNVVYVIQITMVK